MEILITEWAYQSYLDLLDVFTKDEYKEVLRPDAEQAARSAVSALKSRVSRAIYLSVLRTSPIPKKNLLFSKRSSSIA